MVCQPPMGGIHKLPDSADFHYAISRGTLGVRSEHYQASAASPLAGNSGKDKGFEAMRARQADGSGI